MKNLIKLLPMLFLPFLPTIDSKAQASDSENFNFEKCFSEIPYVSIAPEFRGYRENKPDTIRFHYYPDNVKSNISYEDIYLNIDEDPRVDVIETYMLKEDEDGKIEKTKYPWGYTFYPGPQDMYYDEIRDIHLGGPDGLNENERSLEKIKECFYNNKESVFPRE